MKLLALVFVLVCWLSYVHCGCSNSNWWGSFDNKGLSKCDSRYQGIRGFYRNRRQSPDYIYLLEEAVCCSRPKPYHWTSNYVYANWWSQFDHGNTWVHCPRGFFLQGLYRNSGSKARLYHIEEGRCWKPADHPYRYGQCYNHNIGRSFDDRGTSQCNEGYFVTGFYRSGCDELLCLETLRCCKMASAPDTLDSLNRVKTLVMDRTLYDMALLAHYLGYGWCAGCRAPWVGEDFRRNGDTWETDKSGRCSGYKNGHRLSINYGHWSFAVKDIRYGKPVITSLQPETIDSGVVINNTPTKSTRTITRTEEVARTVTHTKTSSWKKSHELGVEISYSPPESTGGVGGKVSYKFGYETSSTTTDSESRTQKKILSVSDSKELEPHTAVKFDLVISKTRTTMAYTAKIIATFSAEFRGFLRWGGGKGKRGTNYHYQHHGSSKRPTFNYRFGDAGTPFYEALKYQSDTLQRPWKWDDLKSNYGYAHSLIKKLSRESQYEFTLTGKFDDVLGKRMDVTWSTLPSRGKRSADLKTYSGASIDLGTHQSAATTQAGDEPSPNPAPPKVEINLPEDDRTDPAPETTGTDA